jgi:hypothetical protein
LSDEPDLCSGEYELYSGESGPCSGESGPYSGESELYSGESELYSGKSGPGLPLPAGGGADRTVKRLSSGIRYENAKGGKDKGEGPFGPLFSAIIP